MPPDGGKSIFRKINLSDAPENPHKHFGDNCLTKPGQKFVTANCVRQVFQNSGKPFPRDGGNQISERLVLTRGPKIPINILSIIDWPEPVKVGLSTRVSRWVHTFSEK